MKLNIDRKEFTEKADEVASDLYDLVEDLNRLISQVEISLENVEPRNRYGVAKEVRNLTEAISSANKALIGLGIAYSKNKHGVVVPEVKPIERPSARSGEKVFKLSGRFRTYDFGSLGSLEIRNPRFLKVTADGERQVTDADGRVHRIRKGYVRYFDTK